MPVSRTMSPAVLSPMATSGRPSPSKSPGAKKAEPTPPPSPCENDPAPSPTKNVNKLAWVSMNKASAIPFGRRSYAMALAGETQVRFRWGAVRRTAEFAGFRRPCLVGVRYIRRFPHQW